MTNFFAKLPDSTVGLPRLFELHNFIVRFQIGEQVACSFGEPCPSADGFEFLIPSLL